MSQIGGKVAIVTGASSGIGSAIAKALVDAGMKVGGLARRVDRIKDLAKSFGSKGSALYPVKCDVTSEEEVKKAFAWVEENLGPPQVVINNAGLLKQSVLTTGKISDMKDIFETNVIGLTTCSKEAVALMTKHKIEGTIININSVAGHHVVVIPGVAAYNASKYAVTALTESLRNELSLMKTNIRVSSLSPGLVESEMSDQFAKLMTPETPILKAKDIADCVLFIVNAPQCVNISELTVSHVNESGAVTALGLSQILAMDGTA